MTEDASSGADADLRARVERAVAPAYQIEGEIGRGGMGIVYRARDVRLKRNVAVKLLPPDMSYRADVRSRFLREAEMAARLSHPNIVPIYTVDERDGLVYFVMELVEGESVGDLLRKGGALPIAQARRVLREVAEALAYAHERGVIHRDIKPDNILLDAHGGRAMVTDFGIARAATEGSAQLTATGAVIGTPAYMSPEQCVADRELDGRSDLYSLGAVAYHMLVGEPPFTGGSTPAVMVKQVTEHAIPISDRRPEVPKYLSRIVMRLLEKDPARRFANGAELVAAIDGAVVPPLDDDPPAASPSGFIGLHVGPRGVTLGLGPLGLPEGPVPLDRLSRLVDAREIRRSAKELRREIKRRRSEEKDEKEEERPLPQRVHRFRKHLASYAGTTAFLFGINAVTGGPHPFWWAVFPALGMAMGVLSEAGSLWAAGARLRDVFGRSAALPARAGATVPPSIVLAAAATSDVPGVSAEVLASPRGAIVKQAIVDRRSVHDLVSRLSDAERGMMPNAAGSADALFERIVALAAALHRLDQQVDPARLPVLEERIARVEGSSDNGADGERRLGLLRRQRDMLADLMRSRDTLAEQYESAGLLLENLALDLLKVRSSGLKSALDGVTSVTQEARALSREIGYVLDAAEELRALEGKERT